MISVKIPMIFDRNDTYTWLFRTVWWAVDNCQSFCPAAGPINEATSPVLDSITLEPYIVRDPKDLHYTFTFKDKRDATLFMLKWS